MHGERGGWRREREFRLETYMQRQKESEGYIPSSS